MQLGPEFRDSFGDSIDEISCFIKICICTSLSLSECVS